MKVTPAGTASAPEDVARVTDKYTSLHKMLIKDELATWALTEDVPEEAEQPIIAMLAAFCADEFGIPDPRYARLQIEGALFLPQLSIAERQLRRVLSKRPVAYPAGSEYF